MNIESILAIRLSELDLGTEETNLIEQYIQLLLKVNRRISLTKVVDFDTWFTVHIEDSIKAYSHFKKLGAGFFIDSGSGNGLPGVIFAILSGKKFILCDVDSKKCEFLKTVCYRLKLDGEVYCGPIEDLALNEEKNLCFLYRGLGPKVFLEKQFKLTPFAGHFRFISSEQSPLFKGSAVVSYELSNNSSRFLEISPIK